MSLHDFSAFPYLSFSSKTSAGFLFIRPKICSRAPSKSFGCSLRKLHKKNHISNIKPELWKRRRLPREYDWTSSYTSFLSLIYYVLRGIDLPGAYFRLLPPRALLAPICPLRAPTWTTPLLLLDGDSFSFFIWYNFLPFFLFRLFSYYIHTRMLSSSLHSLYCCATVPRIQQSTSKFSRTKPQRKCVAIRVRQRKQAATVGESEHMPSSIYFAARLTSQHERRNRTLPGLQNLQLPTPRWCDPRRVLL